MLRNMNLPERPSKEEIKERLKKAGEELFALQMEIKNHKVPVCVLIEGWGAAVLLPLFSAAL